MSSNQDINTIIARHSARWATEVVAHPLTYPDTPVVSYLGRNWPDRAANRDRRGLDIGFGGGRHLMLLAEFGFKPCGIDISQETIDAAGALLAGRGIAADLRLETIEETSIAPGSIDVVVYYGAAFLSPLDNMRRCLRNVFTLLKPGGGMLVNFRTPENWMFGFGKCLEGSTYELDARAGPYAGNVYTFLTSQQSRALLSEVGFKIVNSERYESHRKNETERHCWTVHWVSK